MKKKETEGAKHSQSLSREKKTHEEEAEEGMEQSRGLVRVHRNEQGDDCIKRKPSHRVCVSNRSKWRLETHQALLASPQVKILIITTRNILKIYIRQY